MPEAREPELESLVLLRTKATAKQRIRSFPLWARIAFFPAWLTAEAYVDACHGERLPSKIGGLIWPTLVAAFTTGIWLYGARELLGRF